MLVMRCDLLAMKTLEMLDLYYCHQHYLDRLNINFMDHMLYEIVVRSVMALREACLGMRTLLMANEYAITAMRQ